MPKASGATGAPRVQRVDRRLVRSLDHGVAATKLLDVADLDRLVVFGEQVERPRLEPQVDVLGDEDDAAPGLGLAQPQRGAEDAVVVGVAAQDARRFRQLAVVGQHAHAARGGAVQGDPLAQQVAAGEGVELADELPRLQVHHAVALLELIELLEDCDRHRHVVLLEVPQRLAVVEDHRGVEHEDLGGARRREQRIAIGDVKRQGVGKIGQGAAEGLVHGLSAYRSAGERPSFGAKPRAGGMVAFQEERRSGSAPADESP